MEKDVLAEYAKESDIRRKDLSNIKYNREKNVKLIKLLSVHLSAHVGKQYFFQIIIFVNNVTYLQISKY